jgi:hypothetical protein
MALLKVQQGWYLPVGYGLLVYALNGRRRDIGFVRYSLGKRYNSLFALEYILLSIPFVCASLFRQDYWLALVYPFLAVLISYLPCFRIKSMSVSNPLFLKGNYRYQIAFRKNFLLLLLCYLVAGLGLFHANRAVFYLFGAFAQALYILPLLEHEALPYIRQYTSVRALLRTNVKYVFHSHFILFLPLWLMFVCMENLSLDTSLYMLLFYFCISLLACTAMMCGYLVRQPLMAFFLFAVLVPLFLVPLAEPAAVLLPVVIILLLKKLLHFYLDKLFRYDTNQQSV